MRNCVGIVVTHIYSLKAESSRCSLSVVETVLAISLDNQQSSKAFLSNATTNAEIPIHQQGAANTQDQTKECAPTEALA